MKRRFLRRRGGGDYRGGGATFAVGFAETEGESEEERETHGGGYKRRGDASGRLVVSGRR